MSYTFGESSKYPGKSIEQVAMKDYLHLVNLLDYLHSGDDLKKNIEDIFEKLNNFIPLSGCKACGKDSEYFHVGIRVGSVYNPYKDKDEMRPLDVITDLVDLRCKEHTKNPPGMERSYSPIKFNLLRSYSMEPKWVKEKINNALLYLAGFSGSKTKKNCEDFFNNLKQREKLMKPMDLIKKVTQTTVKPYQSELF